MSDAGLVLAAAVAVIDALAGGVKRLPGDAGRIVDPGLLRLRVAAGCLTLLNDGPSRFFQARVNFVQLRLTLDLNTEVIEARFAPARRNGEIHARIVEHPFGVVVFDDRGLGREQRRVETDGGFDAGDGNVNVHPFHDANSFRMAGFLTDTSQGKADDVLD